MTTKYLDGIDKTMVDNISAGAFNNRSYFGYKSKVLKSGICKYYRRKQFDKFEWCIIEMMLFGLKNKGLLTNVLNRLKIVLMEEIVCDQMGDIIYCIGIFNDIDKNNYELDIKIIKILEICSIITKLERARIVSYVNCWWKFNSLNYNLNSIPIDKIIKFKKKNDSDELLKYGEIFINLIERKDEKLLDIYNKLYNNTEEYGTRYRRKDAVYLLFEIIENRYSSNKKFMVLFEFVKTMFFRKGMTERRAFGVWIMIIVWKYDTLNFEIVNNGFEMTKEELTPYLQNRTKINIDEKYVVEDYHISKHFGISSFGNEGSKVIGENLDILGQNCIKYRQLYVDDKNGNGPKTPNIVSTVLEFINPKHKTKTQFKFKIVPNFPNIKNNINSLLKYYTIKPISDTEYYNIIKLPHGQKLTSSSKKSVYMDKTHVYKGPFTANDKKLNNNIRFTMALKIIETLSGLPVGMKSLLEFEIKEKNNYYFIVYKNIGNTENLIDSKSTIVDTTLLSKSLVEMTKQRGDKEPSKKIKIYPRGVVKRISDIISLFPSKFTIEIKNATLQHLYYRYLLNVGDSGTQNVLYREDNSNRLIAGIDMEEIRGKDQGTTKLEYLFNSRYNKKIALFRDCIKNVKVLEYSKIEEYKSMFDKLGIDINNIKKKIEKFDKSPLKSLI